MIGTLTDVERTRLLLLAALAAGGGALGAAFFFEHGVGVEPCELCFYQRIPHGVVAALAALALTPWLERLRRPAVILCGVLFLVGAGLGFYHVGVEQHWWESVTTCGGALPQQMTASQLMAQLNAPAPPACDEVSWSFYGISLAGFNALYSTLMGGATLLAARAVRASSDAVDLPKTP